MSTKTQLLPPLGCGDIALINAFAPAMMAVLQEQIRFGAFVQDMRPGMGVFEAEAEERRGRFLAK